MNEFILILPTLIVLVGALVLMLLSMYEKSLQKLILLLHLYF